MDPQKRQIRKLKRDIKKAGGKRLRHQLKRDLNENPEDAAHSEIDYGKLQSKTLNGLDQDATRRQPDSDETTP